MSPFNCHGWVRILVVQFIRKWCQNGGHRYRTVLWRHIWLPRIPSDGNWRNIITAYKAIYAYYFTEIILYLYYWAYTLFFIPFLTIETFLIWTIVHKYFQELAFLILLYSSKPNIISWPFFAQFFSLVYSYCNDKAVNKICYENSSNLKAAIRILAKVFTTN